ncbi:MAG: response regulator [Anaerolineales bacterium]|nr:response regulator [Anaerolineales bacterium]
MRTAWYIDDDQEMINAITLMLQLLGFQTRPFLSARPAAQALLAGENPDILLLDISMPEVTGIDLLEFIRRRKMWDHLPVIMLSSEAADTQVDKALHLGADGYTFKPATIEELENAIQSAFQKRKKIQG